MTKHSKKHWISLSFVVTAVALAGCAAGESDEVEIGDQRVELVPSRMRASGVIHTRDVDVVACYKDNVNSYNECIDTHNECYHDWCNDVFNYHMWVDCEQGEGAIELVAEPEIPDGC